MLLPDGVKAFVTTLFNHLLVPDTKALAGMRNNYSEAGLMLTGLSFPVFPSLRDAKVLRGRME